MDSDTRQFINSLDDKAKDFRVYTITDKVTASELLTRRQAVARCYECDESHRPIIVEEVYIKKYRELDACDSVYSSIFCAHSLLGTVGLLWEILARARDERISKND